MNSVYQVPLSFAQEGVDEIILRSLGIDAQPRDLKAWEEMLERLRNPQGEVTIGIVGKYVGYEDSYKSLREALLHGGLTHSARVVIRWVEAEDIHRSSAHAQLRDLDGILVPGGFGIRGIEGMIETIRYARVEKIPCFGICLGMQTMVIEFVRHACELEKAHSTEFDPATPHRIFFKLRELKGVEDLGGTMRLGAWPCRLAPGSLAEQAYGRREISERHRHRYEFNLEYKEAIEARGMIVSGETPDGTYVEICEIRAHPWFLGCQFHPEFKSKPLEPQPLFSAFVGAAYQRALGRQAEEQKADAEQFLRLRAVE